MQTTSQFDLLTVREASSYLRVSRSTLFKLMKSGELRRTRVRERCVRISRRELERYVERAKR